MVKKMVKFYFMVLFVGITKRPNPDVVRMLVKILVAVGRRLKVCAGFV